MKRLQLIAFGLIVLLSLLCGASGAAQGAAPPDAPLHLADATPGPQSLVGNAQNVDLLGQIGGAFSAVAVQGVYAYVGIGPRLVVLDVTPGREPTKVGETSPLATWISAIAVAGTYVYVGVGQDGLRVINVANPSVPLAIGSFTGGSVGALQVVGHYAYLVSDGLRILDVADPAHPVEVGFYAASYPRDVAVLGHYAYLAGTYMGLNIIDVADPTRPTLAGSFNAPYAWSVVVVGQYAYLIEGSLIILDVSNPAVPVQVGSFTNMHGTSQVRVAFGLAYVVHRGGLHVFDVSTPEAVEFVGDYALYDAVSVAVAGQYAYLIGESVMAVLDLDDPSQPNRVGTYTSFDRVAAVATDGRTAYVAAGQGLYLVDVSSPNSLAQTGYLWDRYDAEDVALSGNYAYVAFGDDGLHVVDVSTPGGRTVASESGSSVRGVAVTNQYAYVTGVASRLRVLDVSAGSPRQVSPTLPGKGYRVALKDQYAYVAAFDDGVRIIDVADPAHPTEVGSYTPPSSSGSTAYAYDVAVAGHYAYVGLGSGGLDVVDITNPAAPVHVGQYTPPGGASIEGIEVVGRYAYLASRALGLRVVDVINPASPVEVGFFTDFGQTTAVAVKGDTIYVGTVSEGLWLLRFTGAPHLVTSAFRPLPNGYRFANAKGHASCAILRDAFKPGQVDPTCYLLPGRADYNAAVKKVEGGSCFGMSLSSALLYEGWAIPSDFLSQQHVARTYDLASPCPGGVERCRDSGWDATAAADFIVRHQAYGIGHQYQTSRLAGQQHGLPETVHLITQSVDAGLRDPYLIEVWGSYRGTCAGHALVPYAYDQSGTRTNVYVYDPNHPAATDQVVTFDMSGPGAWRYDLNFSKLAGETIIWQSGEQCASVAVTPVSLFKQKQDAPWWPFLSSGKGGDATAQHYVTADGDGELLLTDNQGRRLGFQEGAFFAEIPNAMRDIPVTGVLPGVTPDYPDSYLLDTASPFTVSFQRGGSGPVQVTDIAPGGIAQIAGWGQHLSTDVIHTDPGLRRASVTAGSQGSDRAIRLVAVAPDRVTSAEVMDFSLGGQQPAALAFGDHGSTQDSVRFTSGSGGQYRLWLARQAGADLTEFRATRIPLNAGATHTLSIDWANPGAVRLEVDEGSNGTVDRTIALTNEAGRYKIALPVIIQNFSLSHAGP